LARASGAQILGNPPRWAARSGHCGGIGDTTAEIPGCAFCCTYCTEAINPYFDKKCEGVQHYPHRPEFDVKSALWITTPPSGNSPSGAGARRAPDRILATPGVKRRLLVKESDNSSGTNRGGA
jgi:hypothetical protein